MHRPDVKNYNGDIDSFTSSHDITA